MGHSPWPRVGGSVNCSFTPFCGAGGCGLRPCSRQCAGLPALPGGLQHPCPGRASHFPPSLAPRPLVMWRLPVGQREANSRAVVCVPSVRRRGRTSPGDARGRAGFPASPFRSGRMNLGSPLRGVSPVCGARQSRVWVGAAARPCGVERGALEWEQLLWQSTSSSGRVTDFFLKNTAVIRKKKVNSSALTIFRVILFL